MNWQQLATFGILLLTLGSFSWRRLRRKGVEHDCASCSIAQAYLAKQKQAVAAKH